MKLGENVFLICCFSAGCGKLFTVCSRLDRQDGSLDDRLWEDYGFAVAPHRGPPHSLGGGQSRGRLPVGPGQPHRYTGQHAACDLNAALNTPGNSLSVLPNPNQQGREWLPVVSETAVLNCGMNSIRKNKQCEDVIESDKTFGTVCYQVNTSKHRFPVIRLGLQQKVGGGRWDL